MGKLTLRYQIKNKNDVELISFNGEFSWAFSRTYRVMYPYSFENIDDGLVINNRGNLLSFSISIPVWKKS